MDFEEELKDLEGAYKHGLTTTMDEIKVLMPGLLNRMERFVYLHKKQEEIVEKLDTLRAKLGQESDVCDECNRGDKDE